MNEMELKTLETAPHEEWVLYLILKKLADFKSGWIGKHPMSKTNCEKLAQKLSRPSSQGRPSVNYDRKDIDRMLTRMQLKGLVVREPFFDDELILQLPMSPIKYEKKDASSETATDKDSREKLPRKSNSNPLESLAQSDNQSFNSSPSVLKDINTINTSNTDNAWGDDFNISAESNGLTLEKIKELIASKGTVLYPNSQTSNAIYKGWLRYGVDEAELIKAIETASEKYSTTQTPNNIDEALRQSRGSKNGSRGLVL